MKKTFLSMAIMMVVITLIATGCSRSDNNLISVITREEGSGTRGAFVEILGLIEANTDRTSLDAIVHDGTGKVMTAVKNDKNAIGYISLGSLNNTVKAVAIDGLFPTMENVKNGTYQVVRPFNITMTQKDNPVVNDFINYILSTDGQTLVDQNGFISIAGNNPLRSTLIKGTITVGGSTSVYPLMEKLSEAYQMINPNVMITIEAIGSSAGIKGSMDGTFDIGMASRDLNDKEKLAVTHLPIALDGIAIIVNKENPVEDMTAQDIKSIYKGERTHFND